MELRIGELAKRTGLSVRALHHYDALGLLTPSIRTESGTRVYGQLDLARVHRICVLKQMGYSLAKIQTTLSDARINARELVDQQVRFLEARVKQQLALVRGLKRVSAHIAANGDAQSGVWLNAQWYGAMTSGEMVLNAAGSGPDGKRVRTKIRFFEIEQQRFKWESHTSLDDGNTWHLTARLNAVRAIRRRDV
jgi:DNA-binding transcriptional MerR regulator